MLARMWVERTLIHCWWECKLYNHYAKEYGISSKIYNRTVIDLSMPLPGICLKKCKSDYSKGICTPMFIATLFTRAKLWKQTTCSTANEWIKKM
jgi:hypothetical protein